MAGLQSIVDIPGCMGSLVWSVTDQDTNTGNEWGHWQLNGTDLVTTAPTPRQPLIDGFRKIAATHQPMNISKTLAANQTINGGNGVWTDATGMTTTFAVGVPSRMRVWVRGDFAIGTASGSFPALRVLVNGATIDTANAGTGTQSGQFTSTEEWLSVDLLPNVSYTVKTQVVNFGSNTSNVLEAGNTRMNVTVTPIAS
jgi:hypothetical protein